MCVVLSSKHYICGISIDDDILGIVDNNGRCCTACQIVAFNQADADFVGAVMAIFAV